MSQSDQLKEFPLLSSLSVGAAWCCLPLWNNKSRLVGFYLIFVRNKTWARTRDTSDLTLFLREEEGQLERVVWSERVWRCGLKRGGNTGGERWLLLPWHGITAGNTWSSLRVAIRAKVWLHFTTCGMLIFSSGCSGGLRYKSGAACCSGPVFVPPPPW